MKLRNAFAAVAASALVSAPVVAQAATAQVDQTRAGAEVEGENLGGGLLLPLAALVVIILGIILLTDDDDAPESP